MNDKWIEISYEWAINYDADDANYDVTQVHYLDLLGLYETCIMVYDFGDTDEKNYGYGCSILENKGNLQ